MPIYEQLTPTAQGNTVEDVVNSLNFAYPSLLHLLQADVSSLEALDCVAFIYQDRSDVLYVNELGRSLLDATRRPFDPDVTKINPFFWLEDAAEPAADDQDVLLRGRPKGPVRELVTLSWGKTWMAGVKYPLFSSLGRPLAILFTGRELTAAEQVSHLAQSIQVSQSAAGVN